MDKLNFNEHSQELPIMEQFEQQGYSYVNGETMAEVLLHNANYAFSLSLQYDIP